MGSCKFGYFQWSIKIKSRSETDTEMQRRCFDVCLRQFPLQKIV